MVVDRIHHTLPGSAEEDLRTQMERHWVEESCMIVRDHSSVEVARRNFVSGSLLVEGTPLEVGMMVDHTAAEADSLAEDSLDEILHRNPVVRDSMTWSLASKKDSRRKRSSCGDHRKSVDKSTATTQTATTMARQHNQMGSLPRYVRLRKL